MEFQPISNRLNFFFPHNCWVLLVSDHSVSPQTDRCVQSLRTTCHHWGTRLEFPLLLGETGFNNSLESEQYWQSKFPGLRMLHYRKQSILISELLSGYDPHRASQLLMQKLKLQPTGWGYLVFFGGPKESYAAVIPQMPQTQDLRTAVKGFYQTHGPKLQINEAPSSMSDGQLSAEQLQACSLFETSNGFSASVSKVFQLLINDNKKTALSAISRAINQSPSGIRVSPRNCQVYFKDMDLSVSLPPLPFAIYCLYLAKPVGFANKNRFQHKDLALSWYRRSRSTEDWEQTKVIMLYCFNPREDKPFRDAVNNANRKIKTALGDDLLAKHYTIKGKNGDIKRISLDRNLVNWE